MYVWYTAVKLSALIFFKSFYFWPLGQWFTYWFTFPKNKRVSLCGQEINLRTATLHQKIVDLFMAYYCLCEKAYVNIFGFEIKRGDVVVDLGAHVGSFSVFASNLGAKVVSVEPDPDNFSILQKNMAGGSRDSFLLNKAVAPDAGSVDFYKDPFNSAKNSATKKSEVSFKVPAVTLGQIFEEAGINACNFLKFDCEGIEYEVIENVSEGLLERIDKIVMELHEPEYFDVDESRFSKKGLLNKLERAGFKIKIVPENKMHDLVFASRT